MNKRRLTSSKRCPRCKINLKLCFCPEIKNHDTNTRISIVMHHRERVLTSNTANLAKMALEKCDIFYRGQLDKPFKIEDLNIQEDEVVIYLFPHEGAVDLDEAFLEKYKDKKFHLVVPDGSWNQAVKFHRREKGLSEIMCVSLPPGRPGRYRLRKSNHENKLSTFEAIARALGILENNSELEDDLDRMFDTMVERIIHSRNHYEN